MELLVVLIAFEVLASKFLVSYIFSFRPDIVFEEKNPLLRILYKYFKIKDNEWLSFLATVLILFLCLYFINVVHTGTSFHLVFLSIGVLVTVLNMATAHSTYFRKPNLITRSFH